MFAKQKYKVLNNRFNKRVLKSAKNRVVSDKEIRSVGILTTDEISSKIDLQKEIEAALNLKNAKIYSYRKFDKLHEVSYKHFSEKDIDWNGKFTQQSFQSFLEQPFDLLIGYFNKNNLYLETAVLQSNATFKAGFSKVNSNLYELEILGNYANILQFTSELKKYLQILKKLKN
ncbi:MAG: DUF6913 domain-containing protein [Polaribacter sp.]